jgi:RNA polymerase sigma-70 factor (ECF subfamily)
VRRAVGGSVTASRLTPEELESQLARLHEASFGWSLSCTDWNEADAEDVLQTTYLKVVSGRARFGGRSTFKTWLFGVIRQTAREHRRRARSHRERAVRLEREVAVEEGMVVRPDERLAEREAGEALLSALAQLPPKQREVLHLVFYQDLTVREAADVMGVSLGSARVHYDRGKKKLRTLLSVRESGGGSP